MNNELDYESVDELKNLFKIIEFTFNSDNIKNIEYLNNNIKEDQLNFLFDTIQKNNKHINKERITLFCKCFCLIAIYFLGNHNNISQYSNLLDTNVRKALTQEQQEYVCEYIKMFPRSLTIDKFNFLNLGSSDDYYGYCYENVIREKNYFIAFFQKHKIPCDIDINFYIYFIYFCIFVLNLFIIVYARRNF